MRDKKDIVWVVTCLVVDLGAARWRSSLTVVTSSALVCCFWSSLSSSFLLARLMS